MSRLRGEADNDTDHEREVYLPPAGLRDLYGLTRAEAEVAIRILKGHGLQNVTGEFRIRLF
ncbi:MAG: hypothetical protein L0Y50_10265 [Beijerinckiaceae bacterium]|nr:hypothetical protein [Beijerinckiaceae bacterium]